LVNPFLDAVEVGGCEVESENVVEPTLTVHHNLRRLSTIEPRGDFSMLLLTLVATSRGLTLTGRRTTTSPNSLIVRPRSIGQRR
jgi:hypothetical protein